MNFNVPKIWLEDTDIEALLDGNEISYETPLVNFKVSLAAILIPNPKDENEGFNKIEEATTYRESPTLVVKREHGVNWQGGMRHNIFAFALDGKKKEEPMVYVSEPAFYIDEVEEHGTPGELLVYNVRKEATGKYDNFQFVEKNTWVDNEAKSLLYTLKQTIKSGFWSKKIKKIQ